MSLPQTSIDYAHPRLDRLSSKRKLDDYASTDDESDLVSVRMRKDEPIAAVNSVSTNSIPPPHQSSHHHQKSQIEPKPRILQQIHPPSKVLQFFVRTMSSSSGCKTLVLKANSEDTVESVHETIRKMTGVPVGEQRLIYRGKQLQVEQTLGDCSIQNDAGLILVARMRSTVYPKAWRVADELISLIFRLCKGENGEEEISLSSKNFSSKIGEFLIEITRDNKPISEGPTAGHMQIFWTSCLPTALVMLYMSPFKGNKQRGDESIRRFINWCMNVLPKGLRSLCVPIILEFCKLLARGSLRDPLYCFCRSSLGSMMDCVRIVKASSGPDFHDSSKALISFQDIYLVVVDLMGKLSRDLESSLTSSTSTGPLPSDVSDLTAFLAPLCTAIVEHLGSMGSISMPMHEDDYKLSCYASEIKSLRYVFAALAGSLEQCLEKLEECLAVKEKRLEINLDGYWSAERRHFAMMMLPEVKEDYEELHEMLIDRSQILAESFEYFSHAVPETLRSGLFMEFKNEEATGPGVLREWFCLVCQAIFNPQNALFLACPNDRRRFFPNPASKVDPLHLKYFKFSGRVIALALMHKVQVGIVFDRVFFLQLAGKNVSLEDIHDADPCMYSSCKKILEMDAEMVDSDALGLTFVQDVEELGSRTIVELCPGGKNVVVNSSNREAYVKSLIEHRFVTSTCEQVAWFAQGFSDILCDSMLQKSFFQSLELEDLDWMLHGSENDISVEDWKAHTDYKGYKETDPQILWFWKIVGEMSADQKKVLLFFWTSVKYLPVEGFGGLASRLFIYKSSESHNRLPSSHTCFYQLCFAPYPSMAIMEDRLRIITQEHVGSSFGTW
ncbi:hypothetical protein Vadar_021452 [Vaccinium darrowii]|uniref:Uncharacterized protein n=1 Tax=Vaccinium darrowii TaxID=229202 RepID=A0ACB7YY88_9ERIC|nr:hypothetical protein Vadar_021452 [Vaccinium darrowii]